jgi:hypothetical protein
MLLKMAGRRRELASVMEPPSLYGHGYSVAGLPAYGAGEINPQLIVLNDLSWNLEQLELLTEARK